MSRPLAAAVCPVSSRANHSDAGFPPINAHIPWRRLNLHKNKLMVSEHDGCRRSLTDPGETFKRPKVAFGRPRDVTVGDKTEIPLG